jgi:hypothetical protein
LFYSQAYESLFQKHDALKGGFQRERRTKLDIQDFGRVFASFCMQSYDRREFSFSQSRALELLEQGKKMTQLAYEPRAFLDDALQAVCLLIEDGIEISFAHRSFQEYFVARFIDSCPPDVKQQLIKRLEMSFDNVIALLHEIDPFSVERYCIPPAIEELRRSTKIVRRIGVTNFLRYLKRVWLAFNILDDRIVTATCIDNSLLQPLLFAWRRYSPNAPRSVKYNNKALINAVPAVSTSGNEHVVAVRSLKTTDVFVRELFNLDGIWGGGFLRDLLEVEKVIRERQENVRNSLESILGSRTR